MEWGVPYYRNVPFPTRFCENSYNVDEREEEKLMLQFEFVRYPVPISVGLLVILNCFFSLSGPL
jgi:hypothetical protein